MSDETNVTATYLTLGEAAKRCGLSKATLHRMVRKGRISVASKGDGGAFRIDPAEILRFMDMARVQRSSKTAETLETALDAPVETRIALIEAHKACELAEARLADLQAMMATQLADLRVMLASVERDRDCWREKANQVLRLLPGPRPERRGLWRWL
jgi:excisionase family DNA binding protein